MRVYELLGENGVLHWGQNILDCILNSSIKNSPIIKLLISTLPFNVRESRDLLISHIIL